MDAGWIAARGLLAAERDEEADGGEFGFVGAAGEVGGVVSPVAGGEGEGGGFQRGWEFGVDEEWEAGGGDDGEGGAEVGLVDEAEAGAAGVDEEAFVAGDSGRGEGLEVWLAAVFDSSPEAVVDDALAGGRVAFAGEGLGRGGWGREFRGMSTRVVMPPAAAARVAVAKPSQSVRPGELMWTWGSMKPGRMAWSPASTTWSAGPGTSRSEMRRMRPSLTTMAAGRTPSGRTARWEM